MLHNIHININKIIAEGSYISFLFGYLLMKDYCKPQGWLVLSLAINLIHTDDFWGKRTLCGEVWEMQIRGPRGRWW